MLLQRQSCNLRDNIDLISYYAQVSFVYILSTSIRREILNDWKIVSQRQRNDKRNKRMHPKNCLFLISNCINVFLRNVKILGRI